MRGAYDAELARHGVALSPGIGAEIMGAGNFSPVRVIDKPALLTSSSSADSWPAIGHIFVPPGV